MSLNTLISFVESKITQALKKNGDHQPFMGHIVNLDDFIQNMRPNLPSSYILPAIYLCVEKVSGIAYQAINFHPQYTEITLEVILIDEDVYRSDIYDRTKNSGEILKLETLVRTALIGSCPSQQFTPLHLENSAFFVHRENLNIWKQTYRTVLYQT